MIIKKTCQTDWLTVKNGFRAPKVHQVQRILQWTTGDSQHESASVCGRRQDSESRSALAPQPYTAKPLISSRKSCNSIGGRWWREDLRHSCMDLDAVFAVTHAFRQAGHANFHLFVSLHAMCSACPQAWCNCWTAYIWSQDSWLARGIWAFLLEVRTFKVYY